MSKLPVYDMQGAPAGECEVADDLLECRRGAQAVHDAVVAARAARRANTASTLSKGEVAGSGRKPWRQKGTGRARAGYRQSPLWRGGGVVFGPGPRNYEKKVNRKVARLAFRRAFSERLAAGGLKVVEQFAVSEPRTQRVVALFRALGVKAPLLVVLEAADRRVRLAARNVPRVEVTTAANVNTTQWLRYPTVVITRAALDAVQARLGARRGAAA